MEKLSSEQEYQQMRTMLNEKQWRQYLAVEAQRRESISQVAREAGVSQNTVKRGLKELEAGEVYQPGERIRRSGAGMKKLVLTDETLLEDLEQELQPKGDPMSFVRWTSKSLAHLVEALSARGHQVKKSALAEILHDLGFSLRANKKTIEGTSHLDRDAQFEHINSQCQQFEQQGDPIISVDCKKKELLGTFKNNGAEWQAKGENTCVNVYDFLSLADGKAVPYGIYDLIHKSGFVNVGIDHDTAEFAVESIRRWWQSCGKALYPDKKQLLITADGGGSNGARNRLVARKSSKTWPMKNIWPSPSCIIHLPPANGTRSNIDSFPSFP